MEAAGHQQRIVLFIMTFLVYPVVLGCRIGTGSECEKASFVPGHNLAGEGFDVVRLRRTGAYVINVKSHLGDNHTCTLCPNRFQNGQVKLYNQLLDLFLTPPLIGASLYREYFSANLMETIYFFCLRPPTLHFSSNCDISVFPPLRFRDSQLQCLTGAL